MKKPKRKKQKQRTHSSLGDHKHQGKTLTPPLNTVGNVELASWSNDRLPDLLWAALLTQFKSRDDYLAIFRAVSDNAQEVRETKAFVTHSELARLPPEEFELLMGPVLEDEQAKLTLAPLLLLEHLPDRRHWSKYLSTPEPVEAWDQLARAVLETFPHQSEAATDMRWLKVRFILIQGRLHLPEKMRERVMEVLTFPARGDMRSVRPFIRSTEIMIGMMFGGVPEWSNRFWQECLSKTKCAAVPERSTASEFDNEGAVKQWADIYRDCGQHFMNTISTTAIDPRHDGTFGLALYGLTLVVSILRPNATRPAGRIVLRSLVETYVTLAYLVGKDEKNLWDAYRKYGGGQTKLAYLKLVEAEELPRYVDLEALEALANEDLWQEYVDIELGHWANKDLRKLSEEVGVKPIYDKYYGWPSSFVHAQWGALRSTVFSICLNPLHRLHRVPRPPRPDFEDVSWDAVVLGNLLLELLDKAYPGLTARFQLPEPTNNAADVA
jgi:hypothetical protein